MSEYHCLERIVGCQIAELVPTLKPDQELVCTISLLKPPNGTLSFLGVLIQTLLCALFLFCESVQWTFVRSRKSSVVPIAQNADCAKIDIVFL